MTNKKNLIVIYTLLLLEIIILINSKIIIKSVINSSKLFILSIFPSMFPGMIMGNLLIKRKVWKIIPNFIKHVFNKIFKLNDIETSIFIISIFCGAPSNALYINQYLPDKNTQKMINITHFINPLFIVGTVGIGIFKSAKIGFILLFIMLIDNLFKAYILKDKNITITTNIKLKQDTLINDFITSIKTSINSSLLILGLVICFNLLITLITNIFSIPNTINIIINGILEMTSGIIKIKGINFIMPIKIILAYFFLNFGGLCIQMQTISMLENKKISYLKYLIFRLF